MWGQVGSLVTRASGAGGGEISVCLAQPDSKPIECSGALKQEPSHSPWFAWDHKALWERTGTQPTAVIQSCVDLSGGLGGQKGGSGGSTTKGSAAGRRSVVWRPIGRSRAGEQWL